MDRVDNDALLDETLEVLERAAQACQKLRAAFDPSADEACPPELVIELYREAHTLRMLLFMLGVDGYHFFETLVDSMRMGTVEIDADLLALVERVVRAWRSQLLAVRDPQLAVFPLGEVIDELAARAKAAQIAIPKAWFGQDELPRAPFNPEEQRILAAARTRGTHIVRIRFHYGVRETGGVTDLLAPVFRKIGQPLGEHFTRLSLGARARVRKEVWLVSRLQPSVMRELLAGKNVEISALELDDLG